MKLPNGYGSITKLKGNRRNPFVVRITTGKDSNGQQVRKVFGYYPTYNKARDVLADFNREPYDVASRKLTFTDVYKQWIETDEWDKLSESAKKCYKAAYNIYTLLHNKALGMKHATHESRHTCITQMTVHNVNPSVIKEIVGHKAAQTFTERVYTHIYMKTKIDSVNTIHT